ncbi:MAG: hypothetical protein JSU00_09115 [Acidobacteria bacterium]|nr:hypothetical protein [Acidobacteriota bacterium]
MRRILALGLLLCAPAAFAVERDFGDLVRALSDELHCRPTRIPFFGLVNLVAFVAEPAGAKHLDLAIFEHPNIDVRAEHRLLQTVQRAVGRGWSPFVTVRSRRSGQFELVMVYMRREGRDCRLLVTSIQRDEAVVVELKLNPDGLERWIADPELSARSVHGDSTN